MLSTVRFILSDHCAALYYNLTSCSLLCCFSLSLWVWGGLGFAQRLRGRTPKIDVRSGRIGASQILYGFERYVPKKEVHLGAARPAGGEGNGKLYSDWISRLDQRRQRRS